MNIIAKILSKLSSNSADAIQDKQNLVPVFEMGRIIPRTIHQICITPTSKTDLSLPQVLQNNIELTRKVNPDWDYKL